MVLDRLPSANLSFIQGVVAVLIARGSSRRRPALTVLLVFLASALASLVVSPGIQSIPPALFSKFHMEQPPELYHMPYGWHIYRVIYPTFIEPTIACFCLAGLVWPGLRGSNTLRVAQFTALILLIRGRVIAMVLGTFWVHQPYPIALLSEGQFFVETFLMAALTGIVWAFIRHRRRGQSGEDLNIAAQMRCTPIPASLVGLFKQ
jgi:hypothetical protein